MPDNSKMFRCDGVCGAREFMITVEPKNPMLEDYQQWLDDCEFCPVCMGSLEEI